MQRDHAPPAAPPPAPSTMAQRLREEATKARLMATAALRSARDLEAAAAAIEKGDRK